MELEADNAGITEVLEKSKLYMYCGCYSYFLHDLKRHIGGAVKYST